MPDRDEPAPAPPQPAELAKAFARCFGTRDGAVVLTHLRRLTVERALGPEAAAPMLRHLEGQRQLVAQIETLVARGRQGV